MFCQKNFEHFLQLSNYTFKFQRDFFHCTRQACTSSLFYITELEILNAHKIVSSEFQLCEFIVFTCKKELCKIQEGRCSSNCLITKSKNDWTRNDKKWYNKNTILEPWSDKYPRLLFENGKYVIIWKIQ